MKSSQREMLVYLLAFGLAMIVCGFVYRTPTTTVWIDPYFGGTPDDVFGQIVAELANQYVLSYSSTNLKEDSGWRNIKVRVRNGKYEIRARDGYRAHGPQRAGR